MTLPEFEPSALLSRVFDDALLEGPFTVLDVGGAVPETIDYLSAYPCRVTVVDLLDEPFVPAPPDDEDPYSAHRAYEDALSVLDAHYDVCLFWDYPNYLPMDTLRAFADVLAPFVHNRTRGHAFAGLSTQQRLPATRYGVTNTTMFSARPLNRMPPEHVHTQGELADAFGYFKIARGTLKEGRVEVELERI